MFCSADSPAVSGRFKVMALFFVVLLDSSDGGPVSSKSKNTIFSSYGGAGKETLIYSSI